MRSRLCLALLLVSSLGKASPAFGQEPAHIRAAMKKAATFFREKAAVHGGYVYYYSPDLSRRLAEGKAGPAQIWVQPPGTPTVGMAFLRAYEATRDSYYLDAAREAAEALVHGQLASGGWTNAIDFEPQQTQAARSREGRGAGRSFSTLDDGITPAALRLLMQVDRALQRQHPAIRDASQIAREALLAAQFAHGGFPQGWAAPAPPVAAKQASFPDYDWRTENRIKEYWNLPTLNDDLALHVASALRQAWEIYGDERCRAALLKLGDFLLRAQLPEPQPAWAQQYDFEMRPVWARKFEPPAIAGRESLGALATLLEIHAVSGDARYLEPFPVALQYLHRSLLPDGQLARYYELRSNRPLYLSRTYQLTYDDSDLPEHYGWKITPELEALEARFVAARAGEKKAVPKSKAAVASILAELDREGRWLTTFAGERLVGNPKFQHGEPFVSSAVFAAHLTALSEALARR